MNYLIAGTANLKEWGDVSRQKSTFSKLLCYFSFVVLFGYVNYFAVVLCGVCVYICIILSLVIFLCVDFLYFDFDFVCELIVSAPAPTRLLIIMDSSRVGKAGHVRLSANGEPRRGRESFPLLLENVCRHNGRQTAGDREGDRDTDGTSESGARTKRDSGE